MSPPAAAWRRAALLCAAIVALDQLAKAVVSSALVRGEHVDLALGFHLANVRNRGIAFGLFGGGEAAVIAITVLALLAVGVYFSRRPTQPWLWVAVGLLSGGAIGNLADRLRMDSVTDFLDPPLWPTFNLADVAIVAGVVTLFLAYESAQRARQAAAEGATVPPRAAAPEASRQHGDG